MSWINDTQAYVALKEHPQNAKLVMPTLNCSSVYCIMPYAQHKRLRDSVLQTGITPTLEKARISFSVDPAPGRKAAAENGGKAGGVKRAVSPSSMCEANSTKKRNKSEQDEVVAEKKAFEEPPWE